LFICPLDQYIIGIFMCIVYLPEGYVLKPPEHGLGINMGKQLNYP